MTKLTARLVAAIHASSLPDKALVAAIADAAKPPIVTYSNGSGLQEQDKMTPARRKYNRRDMKAE